MTSIITQLCRRCCAVPVVFFFFHSFWFDLKTNECRRFEMTVYCVKHRGCTQANLRVTYNWAVQGEGKVDPCSVDSAEWMRNWRLALVERRFWTIGSTGAVFFFLGLSLGCGYSRGLRLAMKESIHLSIMRTESLLARRRSAEVLTAGVDVTRNVAASPSRSYLLDFSAGGRDSMRYLWGLWWRPRRWSRHRRRRCGCARPSRRRRWSAGCR